MTQIHTDDCVNLRPSDQCFFKAFALLAPIPGTPAIVSNRENLDAIRELLEHDVVRKSCDRQSPSAPCHARNPLSRGRKPLDLFECLANLGEESIGHLGISLTIPIGSFVKFLARGGLNQYRLQRERTPARMSSRTTRQSSPLSSAAMRDLRSISAAHARCTSSTDSSRLASSSAARRARSSGSSSRACRKTRLVASVMWRILLSSSVRLRSGMPRSVTSFQRYRVIDRQPIFSASATRMPSGPRT
jgi:hypothetical protein